MRCPQDQIALDAVTEWKQNLQQLYVLHAPVYGRANAPRQWFLHVCDVMTGLSWQQHSLDPCVFIKRSGDTPVAVLCIRVDDILAAELEPGHLAEVEASFSWGGPWEYDDFVFISCRIKRHDDGRVTLSQDHYAQDVIISKVKQDPDMPVKGDERLCPSSALP